MFVETTNGCYIAIGQIMAIHSAAPGECIAEMVNGEEIEVSLTAPELLARIASAAVAESMKAFDKVR